MHQQWSHRLQLQLIDFFRDGKNTAGCRQRQALSGQMVHARQQDKLQPLVKVERVQGKRLLAGERLVAGDLALPKASAAQLAFDIQKNFSDGEMAVSPASNSNRNGGREFRIALP